jgi:hypothetical protein
MLESIIERLMQADLEDFDLDKQSDFSSKTRTGLGNCAKLKIICHLYEVNLFLI